MSAPDRETRLAYALRTGAPGVLLLAFATALGVWVYLRGATPFAVDTAWNDLLAGWSSAAMEQFSSAMDALGGRWIGVVVVPGASVVALLLARRPAGAACFVVAAVGSAGVVQVLKHTVGRARPEDITVVSDFGSYPSGHVANAATIVVVVMILFPRVWTVLCGTVWVLLMALSRTYLHAHWLTDTVGGALVGAGMALVAASGLALPLLRERERRLASWLG